MDSNGGTGGDDNNGNGGGGGGSLTHDKAKLLALPSPIDVLGPEEGSWRSWLSLTSWIVTGQRFRRWMMLRRRVDTRGVGIRRWQHFGMRFLRSCLLIVKVTFVFHFHINRLLTCCEDINDSATVSGPKDAATFCCYCILGGCGAG